MPHQRVHQAQKDLREQQDQMQAQDHVSANNDDDTTAAQQQALIAHSQPTTLQPTDPKWWIDLEKAARAYLQGIGHQTRAGQSRSYLTSAMDRQLVTPDRARAVEVAGQFKIKSSITSPEMYMVFATLFNLLAQNQHAGSKKHVSSVENKENWQWAVHCYANAGEMRAAHACAKILLQHYPQHALADAQASSTTTTTQQQAYQNVLRKKLGLEELRLPISVAASNESSPTTSPATSVPARAGDGATAATSAAQKPPTNSLLIATQYLQQHQQQQQLRASTAAASTSSAATADAADATNAAEQTAAATPPKKRTTYTHNPYRRN